MFLSSNNAIFAVAPWSPHVREFKTVWDSGFHAVDSRFQGTGFQELGFWIAIFKRIANSLSCYSRFPKQKFLGFRNPDYLIAFFLHNLHSACHLQALWLIFPSWIHFSNDFTFLCSSLTLLSTAFTYFSSLSNFSSTLPSFSKIISNFRTMLPVLLKVFIISSVDSQLQTFAIKFVCHKYTSIGTNFSC